MSGLLDVPAGVTQEIQTKKTKNIRDKTYRVEFELRNTIENVVNELYIRCTIRSTSAAASIKRPQDARDLEYHERVHEQC